MLPARWGRRKPLLLKNHGSVVAGADVAGVCVTAHKLEKVAETMLRAASLRKLPVMSAKAKAAVLRAREAVEPPGSSSMDHERWQMLQDYYLDGGVLVAHALACEVLSLQGLDPPQAKACATFI